MVGNERPRAVQSKIERWRGGAEDFVHTTKESWRHRGHFEQTWVEDAKTTACLYGLGHLERRCLAIIVESRSSVGVSSKALAFMRGLKMHCQ